SLCMMSCASALIRVRVRYGIRGSTLTPVGRHTPHFQVRSHMIIRTRCCGILVMDVGVLAFSGMMRHPLLLAGAAATARQKAIVAEAQACSLVQQVVYLSSPIMPGGP
ncbi:MAG: hypothetical protein ACPIOQ_54390, partial [Promethearchaeia archaeon]